MTADPAERPSSRRRWLIVFALVVVALLAGTWVVVSRGMQRADVYGQALEALERGDRSAAEQHLRDLLETNPENPTARERLIELLIEDARYDEAATLAHEWTGLRQRPDLGWAFVIEVELRQAHLREAERIARSIIDQNPVLALSTIVRVRDALGSYSDRWEAQRAAVHVATITDSPFLKASLLLFAGETILDLEPAMTSADRPRARRLALRFLAEARETVKPSGPQETIGDAARILRARILLLSEDDWERKSGLAIVGDALERGVDASEVAPIRASLAAHHVFQEQWEDARTQVRELRGAPYLVWLRAARRLAARGPLEVALPALDESPRPDDPLVVLLRAELLLRGDDGQKAEATDLLTALAQRSDVDSRLLVDAYRLLVARGRQQAALAVLESLPDADLDLGTQALLGSGLGESRDADRAHRLVAGLAAQVSSLRESIRVLSILERGDDAAILEYLRAPLDADDVEAERRRLLRAAAAALIANRAERDSRRVMLREAAVRDLSELEQSESKLILADAWRVALTTQDFQLAGRLLARAATLDGLPRAQGLVAVRLAENTDDDAARTALASGLRAAARDVGPDAFLVALADAVAPSERDRGALLEALQAAAEEPASRRPALLLGAELARAEGDNETARRLAQQCVDAFPESEYARALLGIHMLASHEYGALLELHPDAAGEDVDAAHQRAVALWELAKRDDAIDLARKTVRQHPRSAHAHLLLAHLLIRADRPERALGALSVAPGTRAVTLLRARLLVDQEQLWAAEALYLDLALRSPADLEAWQGLARVLGQKERFDDLEKHISRVLDTPSTAPSTAPGSAGLDAPTRAGLLTLRGSARENQHEYRTALADYEAAIQLDPKNVVALNNAAWQILAAGDAARVETARAYADRALALVPDRPENAGILDTVARAYLECGEPAAALEFIDRALAGARKPGYLLRRGRILVALDRTPEARKQLEEVVREFAGSPEASEATDALRPLRGER